MSKNTKKHSRIVDTAIVLAAAKSHKRSTASRLKSANTIREKAEDADNKAQAEVDRAMEDHRLAVREDK